MKALPRNSQILIYVNAVLIAVSVPGLAQLPKAEIQKKLESEYALTQPTADNSDIVTAGAVLVLKKGNIMMAPVADNDLFQNTYKDGKMSQGVLGSLTRRASGFHLPGVKAPSTPDSRTFVPGEKIWVTKIDVRDDGVIFNLFTDAINEIRYKAALKFVFPKGFTPTTDQVDKVVAEVFKVDPGEDAKETKTQKQEPAAPTPGPGKKAVAAAEPAAVTPPPPATPEPAAIIPPPPPPPPADPQTISKGQKKEEVVAAFGQPKKIVKLGGKEIYVYPELKVTFVNGKVADVE